MGESILLRSYTVPCNDWLIIGDYPVSKRRIISEGASTSPKFHKTRRATSRKSCLESNNGKMPEERTVRNGCIGGEELHDAARVPGMYQADCEEMGTTLEGSG
jgi:hypothetical protein